jgi:hypothetical protein
MAHRPVGTGKSISITGTASTTSAISVQSDVLRVVALGADAFVSIGTEPVAGLTDYLVPSGSSASLALTKASQRVVGIITGTTTIITCPEGTQMPFGVGDRVSLSGSNDSNYETLINHSKVLSVDTSSNYNGYFQTRLVVDADTSGILTAFSYSDATLRNSIKVSSRTNGGSGTLFVQQVQISGDA